MKLRIVYSKDREEVEEMERWYQDNRRAERRKAFVMLGASALIAIGWTFAFIGIAKLFGA